jgi:hypothetical protein
MSKLEKRIKNESVLRGVKLHNIIVDEDGVGG